jgi:hypothetical protein
MACWYAIGILRGMPPAIPDMPGYGALVDVLDRIANKKCRTLSAEMAILLFHVNQLPGAKRRWNHHN